MKLSWRNLRMSNYDNIEDINPKNLRKRKYSDSDDYDKPEIKEGVGY